MKQKFKRGNLVRISKDLGSMMSHFQNDQDVIILGSYADMFGGSDTKSYSVIFPETGSECSWYKENQLTLISEGGEHLIESALKNREAILERNKDMLHIVCEFDKGLSSDSVLFLFEMLNYNTSFLQNGEFYILFRDWENFKPIFRHIKESQTLDEAKSIFTDKGLITYNVERVFNAFKDAQSQRLHV